MFLESITKILTSGNMSTRRPVIDENFQSSIPGLFIIGDLAGAPVIKLSMEHGCSAIKHINSLADAKDNADVDYDVIICGSGAAGITAALEAKANGIRYLLLEKGKLAQTIEEFPEEKWVYAEPESVEAVGRLPFEASTKEDLLKKWRTFVKEEALNLKTEEVVSSIQKEGDVFFVGTKNGSYTAKRVILAIGQRGNPKKLGVKGEGASSVSHHLFTPKSYKGKVILIVGGGNTAVEAALALSEENDVTVSYRQSQFFRLLKDNKQRLKKALEEKKVKVIFASNVKAFDGTEATLSLKNSTEQVIQYDHAFVLIGAEPPVEFFKKIGIELENEWNTRRYGKLLLSFGLVYSIYGITKGLWPFNLIPYSDYYLLGRSPSFWYTVLYTVLVTLFGVKSMRRWGTGRKNKYQVYRFSSFIFFQWTFLFIIPEFIMYSFDKVNYWRAYGLVLPWPLFFPTFFYNPGTAYLVWGFVFAFLVMPVFVYWHGKRFCSWICGCGGLAETFGDRWRHLAPKGEASLKWEKMGTWVLWLVSAVTILFLFKDSYDILKEPAKMSHDFYKLVVDVWLVGIIPIALYPFLGGKIWCRYWCPLAKYMELLSRLYGKLKISPNDKCIACSECTRYCLVGIDVMKYALKRESFSNKESSCIGCGICIAVCPMKCLKFGEQPEEVKAE